MDTQCWNTQCLKAMEIDCTEISPHCVTINV